MFLFLLPAGKVVAATSSPEISAGEEYYIDHPLLGELINRSLERNPELIGMAARYRAALQKIPQVRSLPDPVLSFTQYLRSPETRVGPQSNITMLSQKFPWFGKLDLKGKIAAREAGAIYQEYLARERSLAAQVKESFYELSYLDRMREILEEERRLLDHFEMLSQARYAQGEGFQYSVIRLQAEITKLEDMEKELDRQRATLTARINTLADLDPEREIPVISGIRVPEVALDVERLNGLGEDNRRELRASLERMEKLEQALALEKKSYWPDFTIGVGMANVEGREDPAGKRLPPPDNGKNPFSVSVGINIPIWRDKYRAGVLEAAEMKIAEQQKYSGLRNEINYSVTELVSRLRILEEQINLYDSVVITQAKELLGSAEAAYEEGQGGVLDLLDSERFLLNSRRIEERYRADYLKALARLELAVGTRFPDSDLHSWNESDERGEGTQFSGLTASGPVGY